MNARIYTRQELKNMVTPLLRKYNAANALLFGSYARNEATAESDIDLVIIGGQGFRMIDVFAIAEELHEHSGKPVDVYEMRELNEGSAIYMNVMAEGVYLQ